MHREYRAVADAIVTKGAYSNAVRVVPYGDGSGYHGFVRVQDPRSPWCGGQFEFEILTPPQYPMLCPTVTFPRGLQHPMLIDNVELPFEEVYGQLHPFQSSVLSAVLKEVVALFDMDGLGAGSEAIRNAGHADVAKANAAMRPDEDLAAVTADEESRAWLASRPTTDGTDSDVGGWLIARLLSVVSPRLCASALRK